MTDRTLTIPIGPNMTVDGGPFPNFQGSGPDPVNDDGIITGGDEAGERVVALGDLEDALRDEMRAREPVHLSTGDTGDGFTVGQIRLPLIEGYIVSLDVLPGQGVDREADLGNLTDAAQRRRHFERALPKHGGRITG